MRFKHRVEGFHDGLLRDRSSETSKLPRDALNAESACRKLLNLKVGRWPSHARLPAHRATTLKGGTNAGHKALAAGLS